MPACRRAVPLLAWMAAVASVAGGPEDGRVLARADVPNTLFRQGEVRLLRRGPSIVGTTTAVAPPSVTTASRRETACQARSDRLSRRDHDSHARARSLHEPETTLSEPPARARQWSFHPKYTTTTSGS